MNRGTNFMNDFTIDHQRNEIDKLPTFSLTVDPSYVTAVYSSTDIQNEFAQALRVTHLITVHDFQDGLYERLSVRDNIAFYHKWFGCDIPLPEIIVMFHLQHCAHMPLTKCTESDIRRIYYAKQYMAAATPVVFQEPIHRVDVETMDVFMKMIRNFQNQKIPVLILTTNLEHALLLSETTYKLKDIGLQKIETAKEADSLEESREKQSPSSTKLFKLSAKVDDKVILFDPLEIDYIESHDGKSQLVINDESFTMDSTLADVEKRLTTYGFFRCHRSYIVNLQKVREIITWSKNTYSLKIDNQNESTIPLSRSRIKEIEAIFNLK